MYTVGTEHCVRVPVHTDSHHVVCSVIASAEKRWETPHHVKVRESLSSEIWPVEEEELEKPTST